MVGVIVPVHGFAAYLAETLDCVLGQDPAPGAIVVVDDGSPEPLVLDPDHAPHCTLVRRAERGGPAVARQTGLQSLPEDADLIALCDADDAWTDGKLAAQLAALQRIPEAGVCFGRTLVVGPDGRPTGERWTEPAAGPHTGPALVAMLYAANPIPTSSVVLRRRALDTAGGFTSPQTLAGDWDWDLWLRLAARGETFACVPDVVVRYRRHPGGLTADVAALARFQLALHETHADLVDEATRERVRRGDESALRSAQRHGLRRLIGRRDPYRR
ncbi:MAG TPA: glycosyltransferase [Solirubrobacteraceae bacterium]|nr:glycosyltransferase [Solirubrobacteraceae bacterium]